MEGVRDIARECVGGTRLRQPVDAFDAEWERRTGFELVRKRTGMAVLLLLILLSPAAGTTYRGGVARIPPR
jgi:hypothetical protein